jgi:hypothetical protein
MANSADQGECHMNIKMLILLRISKPFLELDSRLLLGLVLGYLP